VDNGFLNDRLFAVIINHPTPERTETLTRIVDKMIGRHVSATGAQSYSGTAAIR
jgi:hypothetical protein